VVEAVDLGAENDERMARLREALTLGEGFQLAIVQVEPGEQREEVVRRLAGWSGRNGVPGLELVRLAPGDSPVMRLGGVCSGAILVGLEAERDDKRERGRSMIAELNWSRDRLPEMVPGPLVLVVSQRVQTELFEQAPDFYSWRTHSTSIAPQNPGVRPIGPWLERDLEDPAALEAMIAGATSLHPPAVLELARLYARLALVRSVRDEFAEAEVALDAAYDGCVHAGTTDDRVEILLLRSGIEETRGRLDQAAVWLERAQQEAASGVPSPRVAARLLSAGALLALERGDRVLAATEFRRAIPVFQALGDHAMEATLVSAQAGLTLQRGETQAGTALLEEALELYRRAGEPAGEANVLMMLARAAATAGRSDDAERYGATAMVRAGVSGSGDMVARTTAVLAQIALTNDHVELAEAILRNQVTAFSADANARLAEARAHLALRRGEPATAERYLRAALEAYRRGGMTWEMVEVSLELGKLARRAQDFTLALTGFETADRLGDPRQRAVAALGLADLDFDRGERTPALAGQLAAATQLLGAAGEATRADMARRDRGVVLLALHRDSEARAELEAALSGFQARGQEELAARVRDVLTQLDRRSQAT
jgi:tetratricopeptide (TPR) repeat protein